MSPKWNGAFVAVVHVTIVLSLGAKLMADRATRPRVWVRAAPVDPALPIRGRYVSLRIEADADTTFASSFVRESDRRASVLQPTAVTLSVRNDRLVATPSPSTSPVHASSVERAGERVALLVEPLSYFIDEHASDPSRRPAGEELWVEVTIPRRGLPRPIRLGVKKAGVLTPLELN